MLRKTFYLLVVVFLSIGSSFADNHMGDMDIGDMDMGNMDMGNMDMGNMDMSGMRQEMIDMMQTHGEMVDAGELPAMSSEKMAEMMSVMNRHMALMKERMDSNTSSNMDMEKMDMDEMDMEEMDMDGMDMSEMDMDGMGNMDMSGMDNMDMEGMGNMDMSGMDNMDMEGMGNMDMSGMRQEMIDTMQTHGEMTESGELPAMSPEEMTEMMSLMNRHMEIMKEHMGDSNMDDNMGGGMNMEGM